MTEISFEVRGYPVPQGSTRAFVTRVEGGAPRAIITNRTPKLKLSLFLSLGCKPLVEVILKCKNRMSIGDIRVDDVERLMRGIQCEYIKAIPEKLTQIEIKDNLLNLYNDYGEIEAVKDIEAYHD